MKKNIILKYLTPLEFVAIYTRSALKDERDSFEEKANMLIIEMIALISRNDADSLIQSFNKFAPEVGYEYCEQHNIFHEYEKCPFCQLDIEL
jgi:hypothetical protein